MKFYFLILIFYSSISFSKVCSLENITNNCKVFEDLEIDSTLLLPDGSRVPACYLSFVNNDERKQKDLEINMSKLLILIRSKSYTSYTEKFKKYLKSEELLNKVLYLLNNKVSQTYALWPPNSSNFGIVNNEVFF